jgi:ferredoxin-fold anticodon binding domain-containing protein
MTAFWLHNFTANPKIILEDETIIDLYTGNSIDEYMKSIATVIYNYDIDTLKVEDENLTSVEFDLNTLLMEMFSSNELVKIEVI